MMITSNQSMLAAAVLRTGPASHRWGQSLYLNVLLWGQSFYFYVLLWGKPSIYMSFYDDNPSISMSFYEDNPSIYMPFYEDNPSISMCPFMRTILITTVLTITPAPSASLCRILTCVQRVLDDLWWSRLFCCRMFRLLALTLPLSSVSNLSLFLSLPMCRRSSLVTGGERGRGAKSYDRKKAWPSINHSIHSACVSPASRNQK